MRKSLLLRHLLDIRLAPTDEARGRSHPDIDGPAAQKIYENPRQALDTSGGRVLTIAVILSGPRWLQVTVCARVS